MRLLRWAFLLAVPLVPLAQMQVDRRVGTFRAQQEVLYLWSGHHVRRLSPGFEDLMADVYWLRTVQYFGGQKVYRGSRNFDLLLPLIEITVTLDPRYWIAYRYGATFLCEPWPVGAGRPKEGVTLLHRAVRIWPENWRVRQELAYFTYLFLGEHEQAAQILREAEKLPGAPQWLLGMAGNFLAKGGDRQTARAIWRSMLESPGTWGIMRENAKFHLRRLDALDVAELLEREVARFAEARGRRPASLAELRAATGSRIPIEDPSGVPFDYDPGRGRVTIAQRSELWRP